MANGRRWTAEEDAVLRAHAADATGKGLAVRLDRSLPAVRTRLARLGVSQRAVRPALATQGRTLVARTCAGCGLLLDASWFRRAGTGRAHQCRDCLRPADNSAPSHRTLEHARATNARSWASQVAQQSVSLATAARNGEEWTSADYAVLADPDRTRLAKAVALGRTFFAVSNRLTRLHLPSKAGYGDPLLVQWIIDNPNVTLDTGSDVGLIIAKYRRLIESKGQAA